MRGGTSLPPTSVYHQDSAATWWRRTAWRNPEGARCGAGRSCRAWRGCGGRARRAIRGGSGRWTGSRFAFWTRARPLFQYCLLPATFVLFDCYNCQDCKMCCSSERDPNQNLRRKIYALSEDNRIERVQGRRITPADNPDSRHPTRLDSENE